MNILTNATKYQSKGQIMIKVSFLDGYRDDTQWIEVGVQDQGIGMTQEQMQNIFTPFN